MNAIAEVGAIAAPLIQLIADAFRAAREGDEGARVAAVSKLRALSSALSHLDETERADHDAAIAEHLAGK